MQYFAGLFDAEGYVSVCPRGSFNIAIEMSDENMIHILFKNFGGCIYERKRENRKKTWTWKINSVHDQAIKFIQKVKPFSIVKYNQLHILETYLDQPRKFRKNIRAETCSKLKMLKQPASQIENSITNTRKQIEPYFFLWLAGFIDGDGNFVCNEYTDNRNNKKYFSRQISVTNIFIEPIYFINNRIEGCISNLNKTKNVLYKWTCRRNNESFLCDSILPHLIIKKSQCALFKDFLKFPNKTRNIEYSNQDIVKMYQIINEIKHLNSI